MTVAYGIHLSKNNKQRSESKARSYEVKVSFFEEDMSGILYYSSLKWQRKFWSLFNKIFCSVRSIIIYPLLNYNIFDFYILQTLRFHWCAMLNKKNKKIKIKRWWADTVSKFCYVSLFSILTKNLKKIKNKKTPVLYGISLSENDKEMSDKSLILQNHELPDCRKLTT